LQQHLQQLLFSVGLCYFFVFDRFLGIFPNRLNTFGFPKVSERSLVRVNVTLKLIFASVQSFIAFSALVLAGLLYFDTLSIQSMMNLPVEAVGFYVTMLFVFGLVFSISGFFLVYDWWENR
jgi:hypothetical protein